VAATAAVPAGRPAVAADGVAAGSVRAAVTAVETSVTSSPGARNASSRRTCSGILRKSRRRRTIKALTRIERNAVRASSRRSRGIPTPATGFKLTWAYLLPARNPTLPFAGEAVLSRPSP